MISPFSNKDHACRNNKLLKHNQNTWYMVNSVQVFDRQHMT